MLLRWKIYAGWIVLLICFGLDQVVNLHHGVSETLALVFVAALVPGAILFLFFKGTKRS
jgi:hypothetical protein